MACLCGILGLIESPRGVARGTEPAGALVRSHSEETVSYIVCGKPNVSCWSLSTSSFAWTYTGQQTCLSANLAQTTAPGFVRYSCPLYIKCDFLARGAFLPPTLEFYQHRQVSLTQPDVEMRRAMDYRWGWGHGPTSGPAIEIRGSIQSPPPPNHTVVLILKSGRQGTTFCNSALDVCTVSKGILHMHT